MKTTTNQVEPVKVHCRFPPALHFAPRIIVHADDDGEFVIMDSSKDGEFAWIDWRWTVGTVDAFCPRCGLRVIFAPQNLDLPACRCN